MPPWPLYISYRHKIYIHVVFTCCAIWTRLFVFIVNSGETIVIVCYTYLLSHGLALILLKTSGINRSAMGLEIRVAYTSLVSFRFPVCNKNLLTIISSKHIHRRQFARGRQTKGRCGQGLYADRLLENTNYM